MEERVIEGKIPGENDNKINKCEHQKKIIIIVFILLLSFVSFFIYIKEEGNKKKNTEITQKPNIVVNNKEGKNTIDLKDDKNKDNKEESNVQNGGLSRFVKTNIDINIFAKKEENNYQKALKEFNKGKYKEAQNLFESLKGYKDSLKKATECNSKLKESDYLKAIDEYKNKKYKEAQNLFESLKDYKDSKKMIAKCKFKIETGLEFCVCNSGIFLMGSPDSETGRNQEEYLRNVYISYNYYIGKYEVTQKQYKIIMGTNPSNFKNNENCPVENVTWNDANKFCKILTEKYKEILDEDYIFDLPTEAQWEYACRATSKEPRYGNLTEIAWCCFNASQTHVVGERLPNDWGIYDMLGNVLEWCKDDYAKIIPHDKDVIYPDPYSKNISGKKIFKGGSYSQDISKVRAAYKDSDPPTKKYPNLGFRVAIVKKK